MMHNALSCDIKTIALTDHAAVELCLKLGLGNMSGSRWRMNDSLLQYKSFKELLGDDLKHFFEINIGSTEHIQTVWEASKAYVRGKLIVAYMLQKRKKRQPKKSKNWKERSNLRKTI